MSDITLTINDVSHLGWLDASITKSIETLSGTFSLSVTDNWGKNQSAPLINVGDACVLAINGATVINGYVDSVNITFDASSHSVTVAGRDKAGDLVDCSITGDSQYKDLKVEQIVSILCEPFGIKVNCDVDTGEPIPSFVYDQGMTVHEAIAKLAKAKSLLAISDSNGGILLTRASNDASNCPLLEGVNILSGQGTYDASQIYSAYIYKGSQQPYKGLSVKETSAPFGIATDDTLPRFRPLVLLADGQADSADLQNRAEWEVATRLAKSTRFKVVVQGWAQLITNALWDINQLISVQAEMLGIFEPSNYLIASVSFNLSDSGELTTIDLVDPASYVVQAVDLNAQDPGKYISGIQEDNG